MSPFANKLSTKPAVSEDGCHLRRARGGAGANLRHDPEEIDIASGDADKASDLADTITLATNKYEARSGVVLQLDPNGWTGYVFDGTEPSRISGFLWPCVHLA
jgi:hypothetical protein